MRMQPKRLWGSSNKKMVNFVLISHFRKKMRAYNSENLTHTIKYLISTV